MPEIEFSLQDFFHPLAIARLKRDFGRQQWRPLEEWRDWRERRLREVVRVAYEQTAFYARLFHRAGVRPAAIRGELDLAQLPLLTKDDVRRAGVELHAHDAARHQARATFTSGTTGNPVPFLIDRHARVLEFVFYWRAWSWAGFRLGDRFAQLNAQHFLHKHDRAWHARVDHWQPHLRRLMLNSAALSVGNVRAYADAMRQRRVRFLKGLASPLYFLALLFEEHGVTDLGLQAVFSTGENLVPARRAVIERAFHCKAFDSYGLLEQAASICECERGGYHVNADYCVHEFLPTPFKTPDGRPLHSIVGTPLHNRSMPLLRYDVGDLVELAPEGARCPCGRTLPLVKAVHGRTEDAVVTPDGRCVTALFVVPDFVPGVSGVQFVQESERELVVKVVPTAQFNGVHESSFVAHVRSLVGPAMSIRLARVEASDLKRGPTGKVPLVLSAVPRARAVAQGSEHAL
jgi:phenylacetate-CoA ligase